MIVRELRRGKLCGPGVLLALLISVSVSARGYGGDLSARVDTSGYVVVSGRVINSEKGEPVMFASVFIKGTHIGTVSNSEGRFLLKVPKRYLQRDIGFSSMGYRTLFVPAEKMSGRKNIIRLVPDVIPLAPVVIEKLNPLVLLREFRRRIKENYGKEAAMMTAFYRESVKKRNKYLSVGEAVLDIYKAPYAGYEGDRVRIYKGRKAEYVTKEDTLMMKLQGGPATMVLLDLVKNPGDILAPGSLDYYDFVMGGEVMIDGRKTYVIRFDQKDSVRVPLYKGILYLDKETFALAAAEFSLSPKQLDKAAQYMIIRKPADLTVDVLGASYLVKYRREAKRWMLNYVRVETRFRCKWEKKVFRSTYAITSEAAITDVDFRNVTKPRFRETAKRRDIFIEEMSAFSDREFWGENNVIRPEESIEAAIRKISRKLKRRTKRREDL